jgi:hypothetical protein
MSTQALRLTTAIQQAPSLSRNVRERRCTVRVETESGVFVGKMYVAHGKGRVSDVLCDDRPFLSLTDVTSADGHSVDAFVAISKRSIHTLRVIDEGRGEPTVA